ncbi:TPA: phage terminase large subunit [Campylobacter jejuni]|nr:phage terminase large subunit [Campylobacter jejuni]
MLFSKEELDEFLISNEQKHENTPNELKGAMQRKDFLEWMDELKNELKTQFLHESHLDPTLKEERIKRASVDFDYFARTYFPHYFTIKGECGLHLHLNEIFTKIALKKESKGEKHAIAAPRAHGKSTYTSQLFPLWCLVFNYKSFIVEISDAVELMEGMLEAIKAELEDNPHLKLDFPEVVGISKTWRVGEFVSNNGVKIKAFGSGKRLRGVRYGVKRPDLVILDDLENDTNVRSKDQRDKLEDWVDEAVLNLGSADGSLDVLYIGTILHNDSVLSRKLKLGFWNPKVFRSIEEFPQRLDLWDEYATLYRNADFNTAHQFYLKNKVLMDKGAKVLWKEAKSLEDLMKLRAENLKAFNKEQLNNPRSENQIFSLDGINFYDDLPAINQYYMYIDPAGEKAKSDFTAITIIGKGAKGFYVAESIVKILKAQSIIKTIFNLQKIYKCRLIEIETNGGQFFLKKWLQEKSLESGVFLPLRGKNNSVSKFERIESLSLAFENEELFLHKNQTMLINQLLEFPEGKNDDAPDSLAGAFLLARTKSSIKRRKHHFNSVSRIRRF